MPQVAHPQVATLEPLMQLLEQIQEDLKTELLAEYFPALNSFAEEMEKIELAWTMLDAEMNRQRKSSDAYKRLKEAPVSILRLTKGGVDGGMPNDLSKNHEALKSHYEELINRIRVGLTLDPPTKVELLSAGMAATWHGPTAFPGSDRTSYANTMEYLISRTLPTIAAKLDARSDWTNDEMWHIKHNLKHLTSEFKWKNGTREATLR